MTTSDTLIDRLFDGRYRITRKLGAGGMANVYLAVDEELGRRVAIKILNERHANDEQFVERFRREAKNAAGLSHPNVVSVYDRGEAEGTYYIAMEYVEGRTLKDLIITRGPSPIPIAIDYTLQILQALRFAHRGGLVHRDIKPHNVIVDSDGRVKVADFGIARAGTSQMTEAGSIIGTAQYLSPEQARGAPVDQTSDLYSVGIVLYELLTGTVPFNGETPVEIAMKHLSQTPAPPSSHRADIPPGLDFVVLRALAKDPSERYRSAEEMSADLDRVARGLAVAPETAEAATTVLAGTGATTAANAATMVRRTQTRPQPGRYYEYDEVSTRRRSLWPWLLGIGLALAVIVGGFFAYDRIQDQLNESRPVVVPDVRGIPERQAIEQIEDRGLEFELIRRADSNVDVGLVIRQEPGPGDRRDRGSIVVIEVSTGKPRTRVPRVVGLSVAQALQELSDAGLRANVVNVFSDRPSGTVTGQSPAAGEQLVEGSRVRINVSQGARPITVPSVLGQPVQSAESQLRGVGFAVVQSPVEDDEPAGRVVGQSPAGGETARKGSTITLQVSEGPATAAVPEVTNQDVDTATSTLEDAGLKVRVQRQDTDDPLLDNVVIDQAPAAGEEVEPGTTVTLTVGRFVEATPPPPPPPPGDTGTTTTDTP
jgi:beta-lactam-binding protein with PASTA domain/predicted Ser/Thr protein kinase